MPIFCGCRALSADPFDPAAPWLRLYRARFAAPTPALFLDRDGVLCVERGYIADARDVALERGAADLAMAGRVAGYALVCVTNQGGIGRGVVRWTQHQAVQDRLALKLFIASWGVTLDALALCPMHPEGVGDLRGDHDWRKPRPGMLLAAAEALNLDLAASVIIGDSARDLAAGRAAGLKRGLLVQTGHGLRDSAVAEALAGEDFAVEIHADPAAAALALSRPAP